MVKDEPDRHSPKDAPIPLRNLPRINEIDEILRAVAQGTRQEVHAAIEAILKGWLGLATFELRAVRYAAHLVGRSRQGCHPEQELTSRAVIGPKPGATPRYQGSGRG